MRSLMTYRDDCVSVIFSQKAGLRNMAQATAQAQYLIRPSNYLAHYPQENRAFLVFHNSSIFSLRISPKAGNIHSRAETILYCCKGASDAKS